MTRTEAGSPFTPPVADTVTKQMYLPDTAILVTRFLGESGVAEVLDFMPIDKPGEVTDRHRLVRVVRGIRGKVELEASIEPRFDYGRQKHETRVSGKTVRFTAGEGHSTGHVDVSAEPPRRRRTVPVHRQGRRCRGLPGRVGRGTGHPHRPRRDHRPVRADPGLLARTGSAGAATGAAGARSSSVPPSPSS